MKTNLWLALGLYVVIIAAQLTVFMLVRYYGRFL